MEALQMTVTPAIAADWLVTYAADFQRQPSKGVISKYAADMAAGRWIDNGGGPIEIVKNGAGAWLVNGQHRLYAIVESGKPQSLIVLHHHGTLDNAKRLYKSYDEQKKRTFSDLYVSELGKEGRGELGEALNLLLNFSRGGSWSEYKAPTIYERLDVAAEWEQFYSRWREVRGSWDFVKRFDNAPVIASAMYTLRYAPDFAGAFWSAVLSGETNQDSGERKLREFMLASYKLRSASRGATQREARLRACSICWNAAYVGTPLKKLIVDRVSYKITFSGTPLA